MGVYDMLMRSMRSQLCRRYEEVDKRELEDANDDDYREYRTERRGVVVFRRQRMIFIGITGFGNMFAYVYDNHNQAHFRLSMRFGGYQLLVTVDPGYDSGKLKNNIVMAMQRSKLLNRHPNRCYGQVHEERFKCDPAHPTKTINGVWELSRTTTIQDITNFVQDYSLKYGRGSRVFSI
jgi:hypothetical protein